jgi:hypothetical protein
VSPQLDEHFRRLGLTPGASEQAIKTAYRRLALKYHPDKNPGDALAAEAFVLLQQSLEALISRSEAAATPQTRQQSHSSELDSALLHPWCRQLPWEFWADWPQHLIGVTGPAEDAMRRFVERGHLDDWEKFERELDKWLLYLAEYVSGDLRRWKELDEVRTSLQEIVVSISDSVALANHGSTERVGLTGSEARLRDARDVQWWQLGALWERYAPDIALIEQHHVRQ